MAGSGVAWRGRLGTRLRRGAAAVALGAATVVGAASCHGPTTESVATIDVHCLATYFLYPNPPTTGEFDSTIQVAVSTPTWTNARDEKVKVTFNGVNLSPDMVPSITSTPFSFSAGASLEVTGATTGSGGTAIDATLEPTDGGGEDGSAPLVANVTSELTVPDAAPGKVTVRFSDLGWTFTHLSLYQTLSCTTKSP